MKYAIVIEKVAGGNYSAYVPDLPGCVAAADTLEEIKQLMHRALANVTLQHRGPSSKLATIGLWAPDAVFRADRC
jgi:hypothetical protein